MTKHKPLPPIELLNERFEIVPIDLSQFKIQSGLLWRVDRGTRGRAGNVAGNKKPSPNKPGRFDWRVGVDGRYYFVSRVIYFMANGVDPGELEVDHEDQNPMNNNVWNLRLGDDSLQEHNKRPRKDNTSGVEGVSWNKRSKKWMARLMYERKQFYLGRHTCLIKAARVYNDKVIELELDKIGKSLHDLEALKCDCKGCCGKV